MTDPRILHALGLRADASDRQIAGCLRQLAGLPRDAPTNVTLWMRVMSGIEAAVRQGAEKVDLALFAHGIASHAIVPPGDPDEELWGEAAWDQELGTVPPDGDEFLRMFAIERLAPRLWNARLVYIINYV